MNTHRATTRALRAFRNDPSARYDLLRDAFGAERTNDEDAAQLLLLVAETERALTHIPPYWDGPSHLAKHLGVCRVLDKIAETDIPRERGLLVLELRCVVAGLVGQRALDVLTELAKAYLTLAGICWWEIRRTTRTNHDAA